ncbi:HAUS augmin-like complex subunit 7 [Diadema antillarum]|uniref:HAUS augmin-like complex subunit 7 n=1 Tax=Diadema antillarum TaxID=105358 RepID=UPI003A8A992A
MSRQSKSKTSQEKLSRSFKQRFDALDCPFVDGVDESWIAELLYQPGEARIRLLQWLLSRYDSKLAEMFDSQYWTSESKMDARLQVITEVCAYLGICRPGDIDLVRGVSTSHSSQAAFWDKLLDIVYISDMCDESRALGVSSHGVVSESLPLWDQFSSDCHFISSLAHGRDLQEALSTKQSLFPPDITRTLAKRAAAEEQGGEQKSPPNMDALLEMSTRLSMELIQANQHLTELKEAYPIPEKNPKAADKVRQTMKLILTELVQLVTNFTFSFESEMRQWCDKAPPRLTQLGPAVKRVHTLLQQFTSLLSSLRSMHASYDGIVNTKLAPHEGKEAIEGADMLASVSQAALKSYGEFISVMEESISRNHETWSESTLLSQSFR